MRIVIVGTGYVGLVSGVCLADFGHEVICVDKNKEKIDKLNSGKIPIFEPGLDVLVGTNVAEGRLSFTQDLASAMEAAEVVFIAVGTPARRGDGFADLSFVYSVAEEIAKHIKEFTVIVTKSTVPVGTGDEVQKIINEANPQADFEVVSNPEFLREGAAINDFKHPDRIVVGTEDARAKQIMKLIYKPLFINETPMVFTSRRTSELIKYASNAFLATKITFINEMADLCEQVGADVQQVARGIGLDNRIGSKFLHAGPGYGGSCFPKDTLALIRTASEANVDLSIVNSVVSANNKRKLKMAQKVITACKGVNGKTIAILGLAFKPNTDDMRDAPSITIIEELQKHGAKIKAFDPEAKSEAMSLLKNVLFANTPYECVDNADAVVIVTEWDQFRALNLPKIRKKMLSPVVIDFRNIYDEEFICKEGFEYYSIGKPQKS